MGPVVRHRDAYGDVSYRRDGGMRSDGQGPAWVRCTGMDDTSDAVHPHDFERCAACYVGMPHTVAYHDRAVADHVARDKAT